MKKNHSYWLWILFLISGPAPICHGLINPLTTASMRGTHGWLTKSYKNRHNETFLIEDTDIRDCCISQYECTIRAIETTLAYYWDQWDCDCEYKFQSCLKNLKSVRADKLGLLRSMVIKKCMTINYPIIGFSMYEDIFAYEYGKGEKQRISERCIEYIQNEKERIEFQIVDLRYYREKK